MKGETSKPVVSFCSQNKNDPEESLLGMLQQMGADFVNEILQLDLIQGFVRRRPSVGWWVLRWLLSPPYSRRFRAGGLECRRRSPTFFGEPAPDADLHHGGHFMDEDHVAL